MLMKNKMLRVASVAVVMTLLSTCALSGTFAKYSSSAKIDDSTAQVAVWGVNLSVDGEGPFKTSYDTDDETYKATFQQSVMAGDGSSTNLVAPGTSGTLGGNITASGTPQVAYIMEVKGALTLGGSWYITMPGEEQGTFYCPITITIGETSLKGTDYDNADAFVTAVNEKLGSQSDTNGAGEAVSFSELNQSLEWSWAFDSDDTKDTLLGNMVADLVKESNTTDIPTISFAITASVTQID